MIIVTTCQKTRCDLAGRGEELDHEKDRLLRRVSVLEGLNGKGVLAAMLTKSICDWHDSTLAWVPAS